MHPEAPSPQAGKGLPAVLPPSGTHIIKMFVVPLLIVAGLIALALLWNHLFGGSVVRTPQGFLGELRGGNEDVRKRAASDLAQVLLRDDRLASDPAFGLDLVGELPRAIEEADRDQAAPPEEKGHLASLGLIERDLTLQVSDNYLFYLTSCVSHLSTPVAVPLLKKMALDGGPGPERAQKLRRWRALWALANLGDNLNRFDKLPADRQEAVIAGFEEQVGEEDNRGRWAREAAAYLKGRREGKPPSLGVEEVLVQCMGDDNPFLREFAVFAVNFWPGGSEVEEGLAARLSDRGEGEDQAAEFFAGAKNLEVQFRKTEGLSIRYNAAVALARRGSDRAPLDVLGEMLDESSQMEKHTVRSAKDGHEGPDEGAAYTTIENALRAVAQLHRNNPRVNLAALDTAIDKLKDSASPAIRKEAERTRAALGK